MKFCIFRVSLFQPRFVSIVMRLVITAMHDSESSWQSLSCWFFVQKGKSFCFKQSVISIALAVGLITGVPTLGWPNDAQAANSALSDLSVLISGPPIKDPGALLRYALPIDNKAIREVQKPLEDITDSLKISGVKALDSVERVRFLFFLLRNFTFPLCPCGISLIVIV